MNKSTIAIISLALCANLSLAHAEQKCNAKIIKTTPDADFDIKSDETVVHKITGLMWKRCSEGLSGANCENGTATEFTWAGALNHVVELNKNGGFAGHSDWRVPNIKELASIVESSCYEPAINATVFPNTNTSDMYWSSSPNMEINHNAWAVSYKYGFGSHINNKHDNNTNRVRLVRGGL